MSKKYQESRYGSSEAEVIITRTEVMTCSGLYATELNWTGRKIISFYLWYLHIMLHPIKDAGMTLHHVPTTVSSRMSE